MAPLHGTVAAAVTPLRDRGARPDEDAFGPLADRYADAGLDGLLALGTTGEGILLGGAERRRVLECFIEAAAGRLQVGAHCGAQTTAGSVALAEHAAANGADAVAVIAPPYYPLDSESLLVHFAAVARACAPTPFYVYEFAARSGYAVPLEVISRLRDAAPNLVGLKVSDAPWAAFAPYLLEGLDVFVGPESLIRDGIAGGAVGAVSGLAAAFPELVAELVRAPSAEGAARVADVRAAVDGYPFQAALKALLAMQGVPVRRDVRAPLRDLRDEELAALERAAATPGSPIAEALAACGRRVAR
jgi:dihydrodipicolinate synthase/N-acetylneuraminate lyase